MPKKRAHSSSSIDSPGSKYGATNTTKSGSDTLKYMILSGILDLNDDPYKISHASKVFGATKDEIRTWAHVKRKRKQKEEKVGEYYGVFGSDKFKKMEVDGALIDFQERHGSMDDHMLQNSAGHSQETTNISASELTVDVAPNKSVTFKFTKSQPSKKRKTDNKDSASVKRQTPSPKNSLA